MWKLLRSDAIAVLDDELAKKSLARYFAVMQNRKLAKFMIAKKLPAEFDKNDSLEELWKEHTKRTCDFAMIEHGIDTTQKYFQDMPAPEKSYLDLKIEIASRILQSCHFCSRRCGADRMTGGLGYCKCSNVMTVSSIFEHVGEEPELVPSGTIFTMGCTMRCRHCQNWTISQWMENGTDYTPEELAREVERLRFNGCRNANLVGGEPTPWLWQWLETFKRVGANVPVVWNSNTYYSPETAQLLAGFADVYLLDFKYGPGDCAERVSDAPNYWEVCTRNHLEAKKYGELIIRVLVLPNHLECCTKPILSWIADKLGTETRVNVMFQYRPEWRAHEIPDLHRRLTNDEVEKAIQLAEKAGLKSFIT
ncbi:MAG TPA: radical SAM protein [Candidatus Bathyarchaeia archaeon]|nr:radical SAM protein [Candidatus Bathyarchaeia archaeon]